MANVLLVDDEPNILKLSSFVIKSLGHHVHTASNGLKAVEFLEQTKEKIDLVISDWIMPEMDGMTLCKKIGKHYPVVIVSGTLEDFKLSKVFAIEAVDYVFKPFDVNYMRKRLPELLYYKANVPGFSPLIIGQVRGQEILKGKNYLFIGTEKIDLNVQPSLHYAATKFNLEQVTEDSEAIGQTIQSRAGGLRVIELAKNPDLELIRKLTRTNLAQGDLTNVFISHHSNQAVEKLVDTVIA